MKHAKKLSAITMVGVMLATGCANSTAPGGSTEVKDDSSAVTDSTGTSNSNTDSGNSEPSVKSVKDVVGDIKVDTKVKVLAWYDLNDMNIAKTYKELFGVPENIPTGYERSGTVKNSSGSESTEGEQPFIDISISRYSDRYTELAKLIQSDDSPDCFPAEISMMPYTVIEQKFFQPIDGVIDFELAEFAPYSNIQKSSEFAGKNYVPIYNSTPITLLWYRSSVIENAGLEDPWELYENGEWTWNKLLEMSEKFCSGKDDKYAIDGYSVEQGITNTTGKGILGTENGIFKSYVDDESVIKAMNFLRQFAPTQKGYRYPRETENGWSPSYPEWVNGNTLFFVDGTWRYEEHWRLYKKKQKWDDDEINFVPFPRCDDENTYYQGYNDISAYMLVTGAKNKEGYKALIYSDAYAENDEELQKKNRDNKKAEYDWNDKLLNRLDKITRPDAFEWVIDYREATDPPAFYCGESYIRLLSNCSFMNGEDYGDFIMNDGNNIAEAFEKYAERLNKSE